MNKYLALFCFALLFNNTFCITCTGEEAECTNPEPAIEDSQRNNYACVPIDENTCGLKLYCNLAVKGQDDESFPCLAQPSHEGKICIDNEEENAEFPCKENYLCNTFTKTAKASETEIRCSDLILSEENRDKGTYICIDDEDVESPNACKEVKKCSEVTSSDEDSDCSHYGVENNQDKNKDCVKKTGEGNAKICEEKYKCNRAPKDEGLTCSGLYIPDDRKYRNGCKDTTESDDEDVKKYACKEYEFLCEEVPKFTGEGNAPVSCSDFDVDDDKRTTHMCTEDPNSTTKQCKQIKYCNKVTFEDMSSTTDCSKDFYYDKDTKICRKNPAGVCEEVDKTQDDPDTPTESCNTIPQIDNRECKNIQASDDNHVCVDNTGGSTKCIEKLLCSKVPKPANNANSIDCSSTDYQISDANKNTHICVQDPDSLNYACKEEILCNEATNAANDEVCNKYPVVPAKKATHVCIKDPIQSKCKEEFLCEAVAKGDSVQCPDYPVKIANKATHGCIQSRNPEKACQEEKFCQSNTEGTSDEQCRRYPVTKENIGKKACIKKEDSGAMGCVEKELCTTITKGTGVDCSKYPVSDENMKNYLCKAVEGNDKCSEVEISCLEATKGESDEQCSNYKVSGSDPNKKCAKNTETSEGATPCAEVSKSACELKTSGATDDVCNGLAVSKTVEQICIKNPEGNNCLQLTYCEYGIGIDDYDCAKYALKNKDKVCKKKVDSNKCEEVEKTSGDDGGNNGGNGENTGNKGNKGSFLNLSFGLLLIISIL